MYVGYTESFSVDVYVDVDLERAARARRVPIVQRRVFSRLLKKDMKKFTYYLELKNNLSGR
jgi:hypothetical protein